MTLGSGPYLEDLLPLFCLVALPVFAAGVWAIWTLVRTVRETGPRRSSEPQGFEVKQNSGTTPGAEEKDIDHG